ncbi:MAG: hypothetical protein CTY34_05310 [Methylobacter sp.]|nr:MAG: hypothetical protein CTY34_05310 [Methylobacter sp.]PPD36808.1 MAG: hypothetical protein CTY18_03215 [Methylomonas sp.]
MNYQEIYEFLGNVLATGGGAAGVSYLLFRFLGEKWIENKFTERLEQLRHGHDLELLRLKVEIDALLDGAIRLQGEGWEVVKKKIEPMREIIRNSIYDQLQSHGKKDKNSIG